MEDKLKIIGLQVSGLRKIKAMSMSFSENGLIEIAGKNGQGKTSVLDSIDILLKGVSALPANAVNDGAEKLEIIGKIGDYTIRRIFSKNRSQTTFQVRRSDGFELKEKPQAFLDSLVNEISFNPMPFVSKKPEEQLAFLMKFAGIDFTQIDKEIAELETLRTYVGREVKEFGKIVIPEKVESVSLTELNAESDRIDIKNEKTKKDFEDRQKLELEIIKEFNDEQRDRQSLIDNAVKMLGNLNQQIESINEALQNGGVMAPSNKIVGQDEFVEFKPYHTDIYTQKKNYLLKISNVISLSIDDFTKPLDLKPEISILPEPDYTKKDEVRQKIANCEETNIKAKAYSDAILKQENCDKKQKEYDDKTKSIEEKREKKKKMLLDAKINVDGLELREDGVYYNGTFSKNWSGAESWIISTKLCMSMNPKLRAVFYDDGEKLDEDNRKIINQWCIDNDIQFIIAKVDNVNMEDEDPNIIYIEDGDIVDTKSGIENKEKAKKIFVDIKKREPKEVGTEKTVKTSRKAIQSPEDYDKAVQDDLSIDDSGMDNIFDDEKPAEEIKPEEPKPEPKKEPESRAVDPDSLFKF